ncbi:MAG: hypothetical protein KY443_08020 [Actinobacteria bacterium]|nr:hypothetical protein [Actinomycetota bacterium]
MKRGIALCAVAAILVGPACRREGSTGGTQGELSDQTIERLVSVDVEGATSFSFTAPTKVRLLVREATGDKAPGSVASVTLPEPLPHPNGSMVVPEIAIVARYTGPGPYTVPAGTGQAPLTGPKAENGAPNSPSLVQVAFRTYEPTPAETNFGYLLEPCKIVLGKDVLTGSADCPALVAINGERVSFKMRWSAP